MSPAGAAVMSAGGVEGALRSRESEAMDIGELSEWMLGQSYGVNRPRSQIVHLSKDDTRLLCTRALDASDYECVGTVLPADMVEPIVQIECGMYVSYYRYCKQCVKVLRKIGG